MDDALVELLAGQTLAQRLRHQVHEVEGPLAVLHGLSPLLLPLVGLPPQPVGARGRGRPWPAGGIVMKDGQHGGARNGRLGTSGDRTGLTQPCSTRFFMKTRTSWNLPRFDSSADTRFSWASRTSRAFSSSLRSPHTSGVSQASAFAAPDGVDGQQLVEPQVADELEVALAHPGQDEAALRRLLAQFESDPGEDTEERAVHARAPQEIDDEADSSPT